MLGKAKMAEVLARAGLHLGATTASHLLKHPQAPRQQPTARSNESEAKENLTPVAGRGIYRPGAALAVRHLWRCSADVHNPG